jgi:uncharacterized protein YjiS (DUF1127 family)
MSETVKIYHPCTARETVSLARRVLAWWRLRRGVTLLPRADGLPNRLRRDIGLPERHGAEATPDNLLFR